MENRAPARLVYHLLFLEEMARLAQLIAQVAEDRGGLVADLARGQGGGDLGQRLQLLAGTEPVGRRRHRHAAGAADPGGSCDVAPKQLVSGPLKLPSLPRRLPLELRDDRPQLLQVYAA